MAASGVGELRWTSLELSSTAPPLPKALPWHQGSTAKASAPGVSCEQQTGIQKKNEQLLSQRTCPDWAFFRLRDQTSSQVRSRQL